MPITGAFSYRFIALPTILADRQFAWLLTQYPPSSVLTVDGRWRNYREADDRHCTERAFGDLPDGYF